MKVSKRALPLLALVLLTGCAHESIVATAEPICAAVHHTCISKRDVLTEGTATIIEGNNLALKRICRPVGDPCAGVRVKPEPVKAAEAKTS